MTRRSYTVSLDVHPPSDRREAGTFFLRISSLFLFGSLLVWTPVFLGESSYPRGFGWHFALVLLALLTLSYFQWAHYDMRPPLLLVILLTALGPLGAFTCFFVALLYLIYRKVTSPMSELLDQLFPPEEPGHLVQKLAQRIERGLENIGVDTTAVPFMDVMSFGSLTQRLRAVSLSLRYFHPSLAPVLHKGLRDPDNSVRVLAATSLLALEQHYYETYLFLQDKVKADPKNRAAFLALGQHAEAYAGSQILSQDRVARMLTVAKEAYQTYADSGTMTDEIALSLARIEFKLGHIEKARQELEKLCSQAKPSIEAFKWLCMALFQLGDFESLRRVSEWKLSDMRGGEVEKAVMTDLKVFWQQVSPLEVLHAR